jgi:ubiquinone/menaquinone biosynthesis C-methylase UbiE
MVREDTSLSFEEYFWKDVDPRDKVLLDAGTGFGLTTYEIARRIREEKQRGRIVSVDIDLKAFEQARKLLQTQQRLNLIRLKRPRKLLDLVDFVKADLSNMPELASQSVDIVMSTRTLADINSFPCRLTKAITEFYRVLKPNGQVVLSDECPLLTSSNQDEEVALKRWQLVKAVSHLTGRPHANEIEPEDLEFAMHLVGFRESRWASFMGDKISRRRIDHFVKSTTELVNRIKDSRLKNAFLEEISKVREMFDKQGGVFPPRYILHAQK